MKNIFLILGDNLKQSLVNIEEDNKEIEEYQEDKQKEEYSQLQDIEISNIKSKENENLKFL